jgi:hypothetical protein
MENTGETGDSRKRLLFFLNNSGTCLCFLHHRPLPLLVQLVRSHTSHTHITQIRSISPPFYHIARFSDSPYHVHYHRYQYHYRYYLFFWEVGS